MKYIKKILLLLLFILIPFNTFALSEDYTDKVGEIVSKEVEKEKVNIYFFHKTSCPHCKKEGKLLDSLEEKYENINIYRFEVSGDSQNAKYLDEVKKLFNETSGGVPYTVIGTETFLGYNSYVGEKFEKTIQNYLGIKKETEQEKATFNLPILGKTDAKEVSIPFVAILLGVIDGFNPCAMWVLLFLINMFIDMKDKKKMFILGYAFLFTSALVYFLSMLGISVVLNVTAVKQIQILIALVALVAGVLNIRTYIKTRNDTGCHVVDDKKRKKMVKRVIKITKQESLFLALIGVIALAASINLVELACSLGFPAIFSEILALNNVTGALRILYLIIYVFFYMIDDLIVFTIAVSTFTIAAKSTKYTKYVNLIAGIIMILIGTLLIFKPEWVMFNF